MGKVIKKLNSVLRISLLVFLLVYECMSVCFLQDPLFSEY